MSAKLIVFAAFLAMANAGDLLSPIGYAAPYAAPIAKAIVTKTIDQDFDPNPQYSYAYDVQDSITGDNKQHQETRNGDAVQGQYSLIESDGTRRIVDYTADSVNGFNAVVHKEPAALAVKAPVAIKAPIAYHSAPAALSYAAPAPIISKPAYSYAAAGPAYSYAAPAPLISRPAALSYAAHAPIVSRPAVLSYAAPAPIISKPAYSYAAAAPALSYAAPAPVLSRPAYAPAQLSYLSQGPLSHGNPVATLSYSAPVGSYSYTTPFIHAAPVAKIAAPALAYGAAYAH